MDSYLVRVSSILEDLGASIDVGDDFALAQLVVGDEEFLASAPVRFSVRLTNTGTGVIGEGTVVADVTATCARCLREFPLSIEGSVDALYVLHGHEGGIPEDQEFEYISAEGDVDLMPALVAALVLEAPFAPIHAEDCAGLCPTCGADLNEGPCECPAGDDEDNPFAALGQLFTDGVAEEGGTARTGEAAEPE